jgi:transposase-like protein
MSPNSRNVGTASLARLDGPGASTRPTSKSKGAGPISTARSTRRQTVDFLLRAKRDVAAAKAFFRRAFTGQERLPHKITLDGYQASHRAAKEVLDEHSAGNQCEIRSSKYLNNLIEQDHRSIKLRLGPMLGFKRFRRAATTIAGIELMHRVRKAQFKLGTLGIKNKTAPEIWNAVLSA